MYKLVGLVLVLLIFTIPTRTDEKYSVRNTLLSIHSRLGRQEALLRSYLGEGSYLWALTANSRELYRLPDPSELTTLAKQFRTAAEFSSANRDDLGNVLHRDIFGDLSALVGETSQWITRMDDPQFPGAGGKEWRSSQPPVPLESFHRDLRNRCDRGADGGVIGASLQHAQLEMLHSDT